MKTTNMALTQTTIQVVVNITVKHDEEVISSEELAAAATTKLELLLVQDPFLDLITPDLIIRRSRVNLIDVVPTNYDIPMLNGD